MGSWSYECDESVDRIARGSRNQGFVNWELGGFVCSPQESIGNQGFVELGSQDLMRKALGNNNNSSLSEALTSNSSVAFTGVTSSNSKLASSVVESNCRDSSLIDLKLGGFSDHRYAQDKIKNNSMSSAQSSTTTTTSTATAKRMRSGGLNSQTPYCQVHGCKKDLSSCKDYHKRHKVCEAHSKTAKVIVNGIEQRFCQQCSRFHLLAEFDDGKRSCRKRLAGHNERRRKPHNGMNSSRTARLFQSYTASRYQGTAFSTSSFVCQDILPGNYVHPQKFETSDWYRNVKIEEGSDFSPQLAIPLTTNGPPPPQQKSLFASFNSGKNYPPHDSGISESNGLYLHDMAFNNALSLLSSHSQSSSSASIIPTAHPLINQSNNSDHYDMVQVPEKLNPSGISSSEDVRLEQIMFFNSSAQSYAMNPIVQGSEFMDVKNQIPGEDGLTVDLLQLSSQLQRVEHQRRSMHAKQESDAFSGLRIT